MASPRALRLVGRERALERATRSVEIGRGVLVTAPRGIGRTAFAEAVAARCASELAVVWTAASETLAAVPFGVFAALLGDGASSVDPVVAIGRIASSLRRAGNVGGTLLVLDDAHLLDEQSADAIAQSVTSRSVALLLTEVEGRPLPDSLVALCRRGVITHVGLAELTRSEVVGVAEEALGGPLALATAELLWHWTDGVPAVLASIVQRGLADGTFRLRGGCWWWDGDPHLLADAALDDRRAACDLDDDDLRHALDVVALAEPIDVEALERVVDPDRLVRLEQAGLVTTSRHGDRTLVSCRTSLVGLRRRETMSDLARRRISRLLLATAPLPSCDAETVRLARWHVDGDVAAEPALLHAACTMVRLSDPDLSRRIGEANRRWNGGVDAMATLVETHIEAGDVAAAERVLDVIRSTAATTDELGWLARAEYAVAMFGRHDVLAAREAIATARAWAVLDTWELASMDVQTHMLESRAASVAAAAQRIMAADGAGPRAIMRSGLVATLGALLGGRTSTSVSLARELIPFAAGHRSVMPTMEGVLRALSGFASIWRGDPGQRPAADPATGRWPAPPVHVAPLRSDSGADRFEWPLLAGMIAQVRGEPDAAVGFLRDAVVQQQTGKRIFHAEAVASLVVALCDAGSVNEAAALMRQFPARHVAVFAGLEPWAAGVLACARGDRAAGATLLRQAAAQAAAAEADLLEARYLVDLALRAGDACILDRLEHLAEALDSPVLEKMCRVAAAVIRHDAAALVALAAEFTDAGLPARALATAGLARSAATATGDRNASRGAASLARRVRSAGGRRHAGLSRRESEVAMFAGTGLSDREIAARLVLSVRTVESHLASVYRKLGITSRLELSEFAAQVA